jgi:hypothetical protein
MKRKHLVNGSLLIVSIIFSLALADLGFRLWERHYLAVSTQLDGQSIPLDKLNYNDTTLTRIKPDGEHRILGFGDSFCYSIMAPSLSYCGLIASKLSQYDLGHQVRVVNLGEPASTVTDYAAAYSFWSEKIEHDGVLFNIYLGNDLLDVAYGYTPVQWQPNRAFSQLDYHMSDGSKRSRVPHRYPLRMLDHAFAIYRTLRDGEGDDAPGETQPEGPFNMAAYHNLSEAEHLETNRVQLVNFDFSQIDTISTGYQAVLELFKYLSEIRKSGIKTMVTLAANEIQVDRSFRERVAEHYQLDLTQLDFTLPARTVMSIRDLVDPEIEVIDLAPFFVCRSDQGVPLYYKTNTHWGPEGNQLAAEIIADHLWHSWFAGPAPEADSCASSYYAESSRISEAEIKQYVMSLSSIEQPTPIPDIDSRVVPSITCGSLDGAKLDETGGLYIWGWAYDSRTKTPAHGVILMHNGEQIARQIPLGAPRPDVAEYFDAPALAHSGWNLRLPPSALSEGENQLAAYALLDNDEICVIPDEGRALVVVEKKK